jgi:hypothetical protein
MVRHALVVAALAGAAFFMSGAAAGAAGDPILPLADVQAGMHCTGYSVIRGTTPSAFDVDIEDVVTAGGEDAHPRLLVRVSGPAVDATGIGQGFSGSPIYCTGADGVARNAGAISEGIGQYGNARVLATPIEQILGVTEPTRGLAMARAHVRPALLAAARPLAQPLAVSGLSPSLAAVVRRAAARRGRLLVTTPAAPRLAVPATPLVPGSAVAVGMASGPIDVGGVGTVAYVDGDRVWAFGHSLDGAGERDLFLQAAYVYGVVNNPLGTDAADSYKLAAPGATVGALTMDGMDAVAGRIGAPPHAFPLRIVTYDLDGGKLRVFEELLADEVRVGLPTGESALGAVGPLALAQALETALGGVPARQSARMCVRVRLRVLPAPLGFCNSYVGGPGGEAELLNAPQLTDFSAFASLIDGFIAAHPLDITSVSVHMGLTRTLRQAFLRNAQGPKRARPGQLVRLRLLLERDGRLEVKSLRVRVPRKVRPGRATIVLTGGDAAGLAGGGDGEKLLTALLGLGGSGLQASPTTLPELAGAIAGLERFDGLDIGLRHHRRGHRRRASTFLRSYSEPRLSISGEVTVGLRIVR